MNTNRSLMIQHWQDDTALERFQMISRLVDTSLDPAKRVQLRMKSPHSTMCPIKR